MVLKFTPHIIHSFICALPTDAKPTSRMAQIYWLEWLPNYKSFPDSIVSFFRPTYASHHVDGILNPNFDYFLALRFLILRFHIPFYFSSFSLSFRNFFIISHVLTSRKEISGGGIYILYPIMAVH